MKRLPRISVSLCFNSKDATLLELDKYIEVKPTEIRDIEDWPDAIKNNKELPEKLQPCYEWILEIEECCCKDLNMVLCKLKNLIQGKEKKIVELVEKNNWGIGITVIIDEMQTDKAEILINASNIAFIHSLNCKIGFDICQFN